LKRIPLIVADPRKTGLVPHASLWLSVSAGSDTALVNGLAALLLKKEALDFSFIENFTQGFSDYRDGLSAFDLEGACRVTGVDMVSMERAADLLRGRKIAFVIGHGILQQKSGASAMDALINLALVTGSLVGDNKGFTFIARENNEVGALDMGTVPDFLPGRRPFYNDIERRNWEKIWEVKLSPDPGLDVIRMIEEAEKGNLKALYVMGENPLQSLPQAERVRNALNKLEHLVVQDILVTETSRMAHVVLPGAAFSEKGGHFTNMEGRIQSFEPAVSPPGDAKPDWEILNLLAGKMGSPEEHSSLKKIGAEISRRIPLYAELGKGGEASWVRETSGLRPFNQEGLGDPITFSAVTPLADGHFDKEYPLAALLGSLKYHLGGGTRTGFSRRIKDFGLKGEVEISPEDGMKLNLKAGDKVRISSVHGSIEREVIFNKGLRPGCLFIPIAFHNNDSGHLIGLTQLGEADSPGWNMCRVRVEKF
jgi:formate dehydrogenase alpha subunit